MAETFTQAYVLKQLRAQRSEEDVVRAIRIYLGLMGIEHTRTDTRPGSSQCGIPDLVGALPWGQAFAFEVKRRLGKLRQSQAAWILRQPAASLVMVPDNVEDVMRVLDPALRQWVRSGRDIQVMWEWIAKEGERWQHVRAQVDRMAKDRLTTARSRRSS